MMKWYWREALWGLSLAACMLVAGCDKSDNTQNMGVSRGASSVYDSYDTESYNPAAWPPAGFTENPADQNTTFPDTLATDVQVSAALPASFATHPTECDCLHFLRIRHVHGPSNPSDADRVLIAQPGVLEGASAFYNVAANLVTRAYREKGKFVEFWAVDRRPNCLEDMNGLRLARSTGNLHDMIDYYYRGKPYQGQYFAGYLSPYQDAEWLVDMGMEQTVKDWNAIITRGIPDQSVRQQKVYLGGHSLGGFITGAYACWDFDGDPSTTNDAGYNQCAGFFGLDTLVTPEPMVKIMSGSTVDLSELLGKIPDGVVNLMRKGWFERFVAVTGVIDPEIMSLLTGLGYAATLKPTEESDLIAYMPDSFSATLSYRFYHSRNLAAFLACTPSLTRTRYTNQALLAVFTDDNAMPLSIVRSSTGFFTGGAVADKNFPIPSSLADVLEQIPSLNSITGMLGGGNVAIATEQGSENTAGPLYGWLNYNQLDGVTLPNASDGEPYTSPDKEVTDINDFARSVGALPMDFVEKYFPIRLALDSMFGVDGTVHTDGVSMRPVIDIIAGDGPNLGGDNNPPGSPIIPGYDHLDVLTAAPVQNDGRPEQVTTNLLDFIFP
ncbi:MAG: hypothetical protein ABFD81_09490 [Syntrophaceae bacterium]